MKTEPERRAKHMSNTLSHEEREALKQNLNGEQSI